MKPYLGRKPIGAHWLFFNILVSMMAVVITARDAMVFLIAWEAMSIAPFFLVTFEHEKESVRSAGWTYIIAAHLGALPLLVLFVMLGQNAGTMDFSALAVPGHAPAALPGLLFVLALAGFGTKAGFIPLHVWLPEAHPAAPSHVSALMSGVMIKTGIYGLVRVIAFLGPPPLWWGWTLISIGLASGVTGVLFAIAQHDLKRLLAYHSVENIGIIALGMGIGLVGQASGMPLLAALGYAGALFHVINHALFKGLLFLGAGAVLHSTGTAEMDRLGGLHKSMPVTSVCFMAGAAAISGLPPLNGFVSEFLIYVAGIEGGMGRGHALALASWCSVAGLALVGGLAAACFAKAYGSVFLGEPRHGGRGAGEPGRMMTLPMAVLAVLCAALGMLSPLVVHLSRYAFSAAAGMSPDAFSGLIAPGLHAVSYVVLVFAVVLAIGLAIAAVRRRLLKGRSVGESATWGCGFAAPTARMQYTASSFAAPLTAIAQPLLRIKYRAALPAGLFPGPSSFESGVPGGARKYLYKPAFRWVNVSLSRFRWIQHGKVNFYVLYIAATLLALLVWKI